MDGFLVEHPIKMDDLGVPLFSETSIYTHRYQHFPKGAVWNLKDDV